MKSIFEVFVSISYCFFILIGCMIGCGDLGEDSTAPTTPIFSEYDRINLLSPANDDDFNDNLDPAFPPFSFTYELSSYDEYVMLGLFSNPIQVDGDRIINMNDCKFGNRTRLSGFSRSGVSSNNLYPYDPITGDFDTSGGLGVPADGSYYWAVWAWDSNGFLSSSSPEWKVDIN